MIFKAAFRKELLVFCKSFLKVL